MSFHIISTEESLICEQADFKDLEKDSFVNWTDRVSTTLLHMIQSERILGLITVNENMFRPQAHD